MSDSIAKSYDELPYDSHFNPRSHPARMATMARLFGLEAPPVENARVLEIGCGGGMNLVAAARLLPNSEFLGIDLSSRQIMDGQILVSDLGLTNVTLKSMSLTDLGNRFGQFDYIICHGVYSWVPEEIQTKLLEIGKERLSPRGVFFLSYNIYPGWHQREMIRGAFGYHTRNTTDPRERVNQARDFLKVLAATTVPPNTPYSLGILQEIDLLSKVGDSYVFHEHLEEHNHPVYFHEFVERAGRAELKYLAPACFSLLETGLPAGTREALDRFADDWLSREQYLDFLLNRAFRQSLLCHDSVEVSHEPSARAIEKLRFTALARPESVPPDLVSSAPESFHTISDEHVTIDIPRIKAAIVALFDRWPKSASFEEIRCESLMRSGLEIERTQADDDRREFADMLLLAASLTLIEPQTFEPAIALEAGDHPYVCPLARRQARTGSKVVNVWNSFAVISDLDRQIIPLLDGERDREALISFLVEQAVSGQIHFRRDGQPLNDPIELRPLLIDLLESSLNRYVGEALLIQREPAAT